jgi:hypothetical protein
LDARKEASTPDDSFGAKLFGDVEVGTNQAKKTGSKGKEGEDAEEEEEEEEEEEVPDDLKELDPQDQQLRYLNRLHNDGHCSTQHSAAPVLSIAGPLCLRWCLWQLGWHGCAGSRFGRHG